MTSHHLIARKKSLLIIIACHIFVVYWLIKKKRFSAKQSDGVRRHLEPRQNDEVAHKKITFCG